QECRQVSSVGSRDGGAQASEVRNIDAPSQQCSKGASQDTRLVEVVALVNCEQKGLSDPLTKVGVALHSVRKLAPVLLRDVVDATNKGEQLRQENAIGDGLRDRRQLDGDAENRDLA